MIGNERIVRNSAKCANCGKELESIHVHDFRAHRCYAVAKGVAREFYFFVDGGREYIRRGWHNFGDYIETSVYER